MRLLLTCVPTWILMLSNAAFPDSFFTFRLLQQPFICWKLHFITFLNIQRPFSRLFDKTKIYVKPKLVFMCKNTFWERKQKIENEIGAGYSEMKWEKQWRTKSDFKWKFNINMLMAIRWSVRFFPFYLFLSSVICQRHSIFKTIVTVKRDLKLCFLHTTIEVLMYFC